MNDGGGGVAHRKNQQLNAAHYSAGARQRADLWGWPPAQYHAILAGVMHQQTFRQKLACNSSGCNSLGNLIQRRLIWQIDCEVAQADRIGRRWRCGGPLPRIQPQVMMIATGRNKRGLES